jgi:glycerol-3-phosphate acyltransferase PlsX
MIFAKPVLSQVMARADPRRYNGALFVGLNGVVVKSHGGTDSIGFANAIGVAVDMISRDLNSRIGEQLTHIAAQATNGNGSETECKPVEDTTSGSGP